MNNKYSDTMIKKLLSITNLTSSSLYVDVGGYDGQYIDDMIYHTIQCNIICLEPIHKMINILKEKYKNYPNIKIIGSALLNENTTAYIQKWRGWKETGSTLVFEKIEEDKYDYEEVDVIDVKDFMSTIDAVDVMKINIENSEHILLPRMIECNIIPKIKIFTIQFHTEFDPQWERRNKIRLDLAKTHSLVHEEDHNICNWEIWVKK